MNLSQTERLNVMGVAIPVLTIIVVITTFLQSKLMAPVTAQPGDQGASMTKAMNLYMPLLMGWLAYSFSAGLALYFITSNLIGILQYGAMGRLDWRNIIPSRKNDSKVK
jgi:YidC/Oxa1 family membrane protein insertase